MKPLMLPLFLAGALMMGCDDRSTSKSPNAGANARAADAKAAADKAAADTKAVAKKDAADAEALADKTAANTKAAADKAAAEAKAAADKVAANTKAAADKTAADDARTEATKLLADLQTAVTGQKWTDAGALVKQLDPVRSKLAADQKAAFDSLKTQYDNSKR